MTRERWDCVTAPARWSTRSATARSIHRARSSALTRRSRPPPRARSAARPTAPTAATTTPTSRSSRRRLRAQPIPDLRTRPLGLLGGLVEPRLHVAAIERLARRLAPLRGQRLEGALEHFEAAL